MTTNHDVLRLARECYAAQQTSPRRKFEIVSGTWDQTDMVQAVVTAIERTTELAVALVQNRVPVLQDFEYAPVVTALCKTFESLEAYDHLRQQGQTDAED